MRIGDSYGGRFFLRRHSTCIHTSTRMCHLVSVMQYSRKIRKRTNFSDGVHLSCRPYRKTWRWLPRIPWYSLRLAAMKGTSRMETMAERTLRFPAHWAYYALGILYNFNIITHPLAIYTVRCCCLSSRPPMGRDYMLMIIIMRHLDFRIYRYFRSLPRFVPRSLAQIDREGRSGTLILPGILHSFRSQSAVSHTD